MRMTLIFSIMDEWLDLTLPPMQLTDDQIWKIVNDLDCGMICYAHRETGDILSIADPEHPDFEAMYWQEDLDYIKRESEQLIRFEPMDSRRGYDVMEEYAQAHRDRPFRARLLERLSRRKPFRNFQDLVDDSPYRDDWFAFKKEAYISWVKRQMSVEE